MSEFLFYKFGCQDRLLSPEQLDELASLSSRADITAESFEVTYNYSELNADLAQLVLDYFDVGLYYADWGEVYCYLKLPLGTLKAYIFAWPDYELEIIETGEWQLVCIQLEECDCYQEDPEELYEHACDLLNELRSGDLRLLYLLWARHFYLTEEVNDIPLHGHDFGNLTDAQKAFMHLFDVPAHYVTAMQIINDNGAQGDAVPMLSVELFSANLAEAEQRFISEQKLEEEQQQLIAQQLLEVKLRDFYPDRADIWQHANEQANLGRANAYDNAASNLLLLAQAYQLHGNEAEFKQLWNEFYGKHKQRRALMKRVPELLSDCT
ncbi:hypothetical protein [Salinibius halmophilus]|uniref:hypothetical protein n=1 Tax=Salinibius halmophilus TaxID=1853216 RepID=UPI000E66301F|nr:hypothetical protein [Salinibius halmophilus]